MISVDYFYVQECMDSLELENEGNCRIGLWNDDNQHWYMGIITSCGWSTIFKMGPYDANGNPDKFSFTFNRFYTEYNQSKLYKTIKEYINDGKKCITQAMTVSDVEFMEAMSKIKLLEVPNVNE
mgnify:CR=1 FL=1